NTIIFIFFFSSRRRHTSFSRDWSSDVCSSDLGGVDDAELAQRPVEERGIAFQVTEHRYPAGHLRHGGRYAGVIQHEGMPPARASSEERRVGKDRRSISDDKKKQHWRRAKSS